MHLRTVALFLQFVVSGLVIFFQSRYACFLRRKGDVSYAYACASFAPINKEHYVVIMLMKGNV